MTPEQEQAIRARHVLYAMDPSVTRTDDDPAWCAACEDPWPCDADQMRAALDEVRVALAAERRQYGVAMKAMLAERDAARADADALAALVDYAMGLDCAFDDDLSPRTCFVHGAEWPDLSRPCEWVIEANVALAAHEAQKEGAE